MEWNFKTIFCILLPTLFALSAGAGYRFTPNNYTLEIVTSENNFKDNAAGEDLIFKGKVIIDFNITQLKEETGEGINVSLDTNPDMKLIKVELKDKKGGEWVNITRTSVHKDDKLNMTIPKPATLPASYQLSVEYANLLRNDMTGLYRSSYVDSANKTRWLLTTHFEPTYARKVFPCFDRPDLKAEFEVRITAPTGKKVLCNTPVTKQDSVFTCEKSLKMSTYLVAFTISDFTGTEPKTFNSDYPEGAGRERKLTTYGREDIIKSGGGNFAQTVGLAAVNELTKYLGLGYAFKKIDQVGIPDFSAGAMENWGHISFREKSLFFNEKNGSTSTKQDNLLTITHELVHQWFGNLVTLESWDYIWLNEAFANYLEYVIGSKIQEPKASEWGLMEQFVVQEMHSRAFETDGLNSSKPLNNKITDENLILPSFNDIPYSKGASVLRMWESALGSDKFQNSLRKYLKERAFKAANPDQLYEYFKNEANMAKEFFSTWVEQAGYPLVEVKKKKDGTYDLTQKRFFWDKIKSENKWHIPITYSSDNSTDMSTSPKIWLGKEPVSVEIKGKWFILNNRQTGYYRVNYNQENWDALSEALKTNFTSINELNRAQIINDVYSLARSLQDDYVKYNTALTLTKYLEKEKSFYPWKTALNAFDFVRTKLRQGKVCDKFNEYVLSLIKPHFKKLDSQQTNHIEKLKNIEISRWACSLGHDECLKQAKELFDNAKYSELPDVQEIVLCTVVRHAKAWDKVFEKYKGEKDSSLKLMYISALGCTDNATEAERFLEKTLANDGVIRKQDVGFVLSSVYNGNLKHIDIAFKFIEKNFKQIAEKYGGINPLGKALVGIAKKLNSNEEYSRLEKLVKKIQEGEEGKGAKDSLENALNIAKGNVEWVGQRMNQLCSYFNAGSFVTYSLALISLCVFTVFQF